MPSRQLDWSYVGQTVRIYRNLNNGRMSIQAKVNCRWLVVGHVTDCVLQNVQFSISESGRQRVIREATKNVHAWGQGILVAEFDDSVACPVPLAYNPYENSTFVQRGTDSVIIQCQYLAVRENQVLVSHDAVAQPAPRSKAMQVVRQFNLFYQPQALCA